MEEDIHKGDDEYLTLERAFESLYQSYWVYICSLERNLHAHTELVIEPNE